MFRLFFVEKLTFTSIAFVHFKVKEMDNMFKVWINQTIWIYFNEYIIPNRAIRRIFCLEMFQKFMETSTVCTYLTETPSDQTRKLSNDHKSLAHFGIVFEVGKAVISVPFEFYKSFIRKKSFIYLPFWYQTQIFYLYHETLQNSDSKHEM